MTAPTTPLVRIRNLEVAFQAGAKTVHALNGVNLEVGRGEAVALIGESGSGKSVTLRALMRLHPPRRTRISGEMSVDGRDVLAMNARELAAMRGPVVSMVFQEPLLALDPVYTVGRQIEEMVRRHTGKSAAEARARALSLFERVRIPSPERRLQAYPHEMSGGMRQRAMIALALSCNPKVLLADEPTTALDATVQIQILLLLRELQRELGLAIVFVTHDIGAAAEIADRVAVMYGGRIVEQGSVADLLRAPRHPYTLALLKGRAHGAMQKGQRLETIPGSPPDLAALPPGCAFAPRCGFAEPRCQAAVPDIVPVAAGHEVRCIRVN
ncbi:MULTISPECIES: ABC transporter ATP-binding protein [Achromobacter]|uniref:ABC transporter ATP-binding protein n=1 Tax=Achromobacter spanius TaxID=217203 RepID=A0ABY8GYX3_9BURK|nr:MULTISPECIES: ABC transporter ATP-binding protein [Achromobacter]WAI86111.1 ABC transporter ATP-binding protein [Achromobacter spanius]WEX96192.1 ABC transporter ATP-binding protein [Achromobacter sp. SS2-2022]WFP10090.1 ABC transporter ATP-binding protein [Achromobacter spanius]